MPTRCSFTRGLAYADGRCEKVACATPTRDQSKLLFVKCIITIMLPTRDAYATLPSQNAYASLRISFSPMRTAYAISF
eukprot:Skav208893  [mRNA]  locus=scaffold270:424792:425025:+ [translate_table: standard]